MEQIWIKKLFMRVIFKLLQGLLGLKLRINNFKIRNKFDFNNLNNFEIEKKI